jgi:CRISPR/Cas system-associated exonuclease Cas4 (RecB family)
MSAAPKLPRPIIAWSYSALTSFENCPRKYWATKVAKVVDDSNQYNRAGDSDHSLLQNHMQKGMALPPRLQFLDPLTSKLRAAPGETFVEYQMCLKQDLTPTHFKDWDGAWVRGAGDYVKINGPKALYMDWKSGKPRDEVEDQIDLTALLLFKHFPAVQQMTGALLYYNHNKLAPHIVHRADEARLWNGFITRVRAMEEAKRNDDWPTNPNPLCGWCPYRACPFNKVAEREAAEAQGLKWKYRS